MSSYRRFFAEEDANSVFKFTINTSIINPSGTDGSENPLTFKLPLSNTVNASTNCIVKVSDGRPDISMVGQSEVNSKSLLTFASAGIYQITIIGFVQTFSFNSSIFGYDKRKIISIDHWGSKVGFIQYSFRDCENLEINANNALVLPSNSNGFFNGIKGFNTSLELLDNSKVTAAEGIFGYIEQILTTSPNPFWESLVSFFQVFSSSSFDPSILKIEIISNTITRLVNCFTNTNFRGRLVAKTPNLTEIDRLFMNYSNPPPVGGVDIRNVTSVNIICNNLMSKDNIDSTLLEWANDYDWSDVPNIPGKCNINFFGNTNPCYCSTDSEVLAAKSFLEGKGYVFPYLSATP